MGNVNHAAGLTVYFYIPESRSLIADAISLKSLRMIHRDACSCDAGSSHDVGKSQALVAIDLRLGPPIQCLTSEAHLVAFLLSLTRTWN